MHITQIWTYPIKSCAGTPLSEAKLGERGVPHDRRWMLVGPTGDPVTQREIPKLVWVKPEVTPETLVVTAPGMPTLKLQRAAPGPSRRVHLWDCSIDAVSLPEASAWFQTYTGTEVDLVYMPDSSPRSMNPAFGERHLTFVDGNPLHIVNEASLAELNTRLTVPVEISRFRPNFVFSGAEAYAEDSWQRIYIGGIPFDVCEACQRCVLLNVDPTTATVGKEPLATLARYRRADGHVLFGQNINHLQTGLVRVGSRVRLEENSKDR